MKKNMFCILLVLIFVGCKTTVLKLNYLDEYIVKDSLIFKNTIVGGISGIDFYKNQYAMVVDDANDTRLLFGDICIENDSIKSITFKKLLRLNNESVFLKNNFLDLESVFLQDNAINLVSEGSIKYGKDPAVFSVDSLGNCINKIQIPSYFKANSKAIPKHNGVLESSCISYNKKGFWVGMEAPLKADGEEPGVNETKSPIRITFFNAKTNKATKQYAYQLEKIDKPIKGTINLNGVTAILAYKKDVFFVVERGYQSGYGTFGNTVRIFKATVSNKTTNTLSYASLKNKSYTPLKKELLIDFNSFKHKLTKGIIDNIEGITLGPKLLNGNNSLLLVSDDNFQKYGKQLNQFILLEIENSTENKD